MSACLKSAWINGLRHARLKNRVFIQSQSRYRVDRQTMRFAELMNDLSINEYPYFVVDLPLCSAPTGEARLPLAS